MKKYSLPGIFLSSCLAVSLILEGAVPAQAYPVRQPLAPVAGYDMLPAAQQTADYWIARGSDMERVQADAAGITAINARLRQRCPALRELAAYPATLSYDELKQKIEQNVPDWGEYYSHGQRVSYDSYIAACSNRQMALPQTTTVRFGVTVRRSDMRLLPVSVADGWFTSPGARHFDQLQATALDPGVPVAVLHESLDGAWLLVDSSDYTGWVPRQDVALASRAEALQWGRPTGDDFLVVTTNRLRVASPNGEQLLYQLGSRLRLAKAAASSGSYTVLLPYRNADGSLQTTAAAVPADAPVHCGYLPWTRANILRMAFTCLGDVYGWGGLEDSVDCSSFTQDVYRTVGIELPRDADQQNAATSVRSLSGLSYADHVAAMNQAHPGDLFFLGGGHVMIDLGSEGGQPCIINATSSYYTGGAKHYILRVVASGVSHYAYGAASVTDIGQLMP